MVSKSQKTYRDISILVTEFSRISRIAVTVVPPVTFLDMSSIAFESVA
jgi:hypothetical protein